MTQPNTQLMIDIETLGTTPGCGILSIAVVPFCTTAPLEPFYERIYPPSNTIAGLTIDDKTMEWWSSQPLEAYNEAFGGEQPLSVALKLLADYVAQFPTAGIWGNGASFDVPILEAAYAAFKQLPPWSYKQARCHRTLIALAPHIQRPAFVGVKHTALADAQNQAAHAQEILQWIQNKQ